MIFSGIEQMGQVPFDTVYIHGIVRDAQGRKMSKSLGNGIDPLEIIDKYGADALRFALTTGTSPGNDMRFSEEKILASRNFTNKLWNAARFILMNLPEDTDCEGLPERLTVTDQWILSQYNTLVKEVNDNLERFELGLSLIHIWPKLIAIVPFIAVGNIVLVLVYALVMKCLGSKPLVAWPVGLSLIHI